MKLEETIQTMFDRYPKHYRSRWKVLDQLYGMHGNGYVWKKGQLVLKESLSPASGNYIPKLNQNGKAEFNPKLLDELRERYFLVLKEASEKFKKEMFEKGASEKEIREQTEDDQTLRNLAESFCPKGIEEKIYLSELTPGGSPLLVLPDDIQSDWLEGAREYVQFFVEHFEPLAKDKMNEWQKGEYILAMEEFREVAKKLEVTIENMIY